MADFLRDISKSSPYWMSYDRDILVSVWRIMTNECSGIKMFVSKEVTVIIKRLYSAKGFLL